MGAPAGSVADFQDWCLRTYGDSGKTKTVTRRKYNRILQTLLQGTDSRGGAAAQDKDGGNGNAKFKFWVKSKGFQVGAQDWIGTGTGTGDRAVLFVPIKAAVSALFLLCVFFCMCVCVCVCCIVTDSNPLPVRNCN